MHWMIMSAFTLAVSSSVNSLDHSRITAKKELADLIVLYQLTYKAFSEV